MGNDPSTPVTTNRRYSFPNHEGRILDLPHNVPYIINEFAIDENAVRRRFLNDLVNVFSDDVNVSVGAQTSLINRQLTTDVERFMILSVCSLIPRARFNDTRTDVVNETHQSVTRMNVWSNRCLRPYVLVMRLNGRPVEIRHDLPPIERYVDDLCINVRGVHFTMEFRDFLERLRDYASTVTNVFLDVFGYEELDSLRNYDIPIRMNDLGEATNGAYEQFVEWSTFVGLDVFAPNVETVVIYRRENSHMDYRSDFDMCASHNDLRTVYDVTRPVYDVNRPADESEMRVECMKFYDYVGEGGTLSTFVNDLQFANNELRRAWRQYVPNGALRDQMRIRLKIVAPYDVEIPYAQTVASLGVPFSSGTIVITHGELSLYDSLPLDYVSSHVLRNFMRFFERSERILIDARPDTRRVVNDQILMRIVDAHRSRYELGIVRTHQNVRRGVLNALRR